MEMLETVMSCIQKYYGSITLNLSSHTVTSLEISVCMSACM